MKKVKVKSFYLMVSRKEGEGEKNGGEKMAGKFFFLSFLSFYSLPPQSHSGGRPFFAR